MNETVMVVPPSALRESPFNPRTIYDEAALLELAESVKDQGVMQPIVVRPIPGEEIKYEIVFGHRRFRAAKLAGLELLPCILRAMTDEEAAVKQWHENIKRKDMHPVEEALGMVRLMSDHGLKVGDIMKKTGMSQSYVHARLKLAQLAEPVRAACMTGLFGAEIGVLIARYCKTEKQQLKGVDLVTVPDYDDGDGTKRKAVSFREAKRILRDNFCIRITAAPFDTEDATLRKATPACSTCHKLAGNDPELAVAGDADVCTDPECYHAKVEAHVQRAISNARKRGWEVIEGEEAKKLAPHQWSPFPDRYVRTAEVAFIGRAILDGSEVKSTFAEALAQMGKKAPKPALFVSPHQKGGVHELLADNDALVVLRHGMAGAKTADEWDDYFDLVPGDPGASATSRRPEELRHAGMPRSPIEDLPPEQRAVLMSDHWPKVCRAILARVASTPRSTDDLRLVLLREIDMAGGDGFGTMIEEVVGWSQELSEADDADAVRKQKLADASPDLLAALMVMTAIENDGFEFEHRAAGRLAIAKRYGIDVLAASGLGQVAQSASTPPPAARAEGKADAGAKTAKAPGMKYRNALTGETWSGRGLQPKWLKVAIAGGATLASFDMAAAVSTPATAAQAKGKAGADAKGKPSVSLGALVRTGEKIKKQMDEAGCAGMERDPNTVDMFQEQGA